MVLAGLDCTDDEMGVLHCMVRLRRLIDMGMPCFVATPE